jgi:hypothetical protein
MAPGAVFPWTTTISPLIVDASAGSVTVKGRFDWIVSEVPLILLSTAVVLPELYCEAEATIEESDAVDTVNAELFADGEVSPVELDGAVSLLAQPTKRTPSRLKIVIPIIIFFCI